MERKRSIILIPGIQGTKLANVNDKDFRTIWSGIKKYFSNIHRLKLQFDGVSDKGAETIIERADVENIAYSEIINYLRSLGYNVFIFGYDWRKSNVESAKELAEFIAKVKRKLNEPEINFLTHSMGGLVLSAYLKQLDPTTRNTIVNKIIFTVSPFLGSVEASFNLTIGKSKLFNSSDDFRKIARTFPGIYELLPVYKDAYDFEDTRTAKSYDPFDFDTYWQQVKTVDREYTEQKHRLMSKRLKDTGTVRSQNKFVFDLSQCDDVFKKKVLIMVGGGEKTKDQIYVEKERGDMKNYFNYEKHEEVKDGDGTVPDQSATAFKDSILTLKLYTTFLEKRADSRVIMSDWHAFYLNNGRVQNIIKRFFDPKSSLQGDWFESRGGKVQNISNPD